MAAEVRTCVECQGSMAPIVIMDIAPGQARRAVAGPLTYRLPDDRVSFWTGAYPTAGVVRRSCAKGALALPCMAVLQTLNRAMQETMGNEYRTLGIAICSCT